MSFFRKAIQLATCDAAAQAFRPQLLHLDLRVGAMLQPAWQTQRCQPAPKNRRTNQIVHLKRTQTSNKPKETKEIQKIFPRNPNQTKSSYIIIFKKNKLMAEWLISKTALGGASSWVSRGAPAGSSWRRPPLTGRALARGTGKKLIPLGVGQSRRNNCFGIVMAMYIYIYVYMYILDSSLQFDLIYLKQNPKNSLSLYRLPWTL